MKKLLMVAALGAAGLASNGVQAASTGANFDVDINLTVACTVTTPTNVTFNYTSFQAGPAASGGGAFSVQCTNLRAYTFDLDGAGTTVGPITDAALNLDYSLMVPAGGTGNGGVQNYTVTGTMPGGQGGNCATASCTNAASGNKTRTLTVTF